MASAVDFNLGDFITDSLCLQANTYSPTRCVPSKQFVEEYKSYFSQDPLDLLGEISFDRSKETPTDVIGTEVQEFYRDAHILITGGTGFLGKVLTQKLIRSVPHLGQIYLLIRTKKEMGPQERLKQLMDEKVFRRMREEVPWYRSKVTAIAGDLHQPGLGLSGADRHLLVDRVNVVFHSAADVKFIEPLKVAIEANVTGTRRVMDLSKQMTHLKACVHVSTAYSQCVRRVIPETIPRMNMPHKDILNYINTHGDDPKDSEIIRLMQGWPNTYTFSKALCEIMLDEEYRTLPLSIFRPSVVVPTYMEPVRGWTDNLYGPVAGMLASGLGVMHSAHLDEELSLDVVPVDFAINAMITTAKVTGIEGRTGKITVFNYTSSSPQKTWTWKHVFCVARESLNSWPLKKSVWYSSYNSHTNLEIHEFKHFFLHKIPAWIADKLLSIKGQQPRFMKICQKAEELASEMEYFTFNCFEFDNDNVRNMWDLLGEKDKSLFNFYLGNYDALESVLFSSLGIKYYLLKEDMQSLTNARNKHQWLYCLHTTVKTVFWFGVLCVAARIARFLPF